MTYLTPEQKALKREEEARQRLKRELQENAIKKEKKNKKEKEKEKEK